MFKKGAKKKKHPLYIEYLLKIQFYKFLLKRIYQQVDQFSFLYFLRIYLNNNLGTIRHKSKFSLFFRSFLQILHYPYNEL